MEFHPTQEKIVDILTAQTQNSSRLFFRLVVAYHFAKLASMMRIHIDIPGRDRFPVNMYVVNLANSGSGKGHSLHILEEQITEGFRNIYLEKTFTILSEHSLAKLSVKRANKNNTDPDMELEILQKEFKDSGEMVFSFDSATTPAVKQMRHKLLLASSGSMNMEIDEIGSNLLSNVDVLTTFLELFDLGKVKSKLIKNTRENSRTEQLFGSTPTNMLLFGTPNKLLDGGKVEEEFLGMLETGFARRCFFGLSKSKSSEKKYSAEEVFDIFNDTSSANYLSQLSSDFAVLADVNNFNTVLRMSRNVALEWLRYKAKCESEADVISDFEEIRKTELRHRHFKVAKLAGAYAFMDQAMDITETHLENAIALATESGDAFRNILCREKPFVKLANYITSIGKELTQADLVEDLPFYKGTESQKRDMMNLAISYGYKNNQIIKRETIDDVEVITGKTLPLTDLKQIIISHSKDVVKDYKHVMAPWNKLWKLVTMDGHNWLNHRVKDAYRDEDHCVPGFNTIVIDIDGSTTMDMATTLLADYRWLIHTTKSHTAASHRFRMIFPISHVIDLNAKDFKEYMNAVYQWLPFEVDTQTGQRSRKWETFKGTYQYNDGEILNGLQFIPKTKRAEEAKAIAITQTNMTSLERWFTNNAQEGSRNGMLFKYAMCLKDQGMDLDTIKNNVLAMNSKITVPLDETEVLGTIILSVGRKMGGTI